MVEGKLTSLESSQGRSGANHFGDESPAAMSADNRDVRGRLRCPRKKAIPFVRRRASGGEQCEDAVTDHQSQVAARGPGGPVEQSHLRERLPRPSVRIPQVHAHDLTHPIPGVCRARVCVCHD
jgi:hypothetical protein